jgi:hypothetical protein
MLSQHYFFEVEISAGRFSARMTVDTADQHHPVSFLPTNFAEDPINEVAPVNRDIAGSSSAISSRHESSLTKNHVKSTEGSLRVRRRIVDRAPALPGEARGRPGHSDSIRDCCGKAKVGTLNFSKGADRLCRAALGLCR